MSHAAAPSVDVDLFSDDVLREPYEAWRALRDAGELVWVPANETYVVARYDLVRAAAADHRTFSSKGVAYEPQMNQMLEGTILTSSPPEHVKLRGVLGERLAPRALLASRDLLRERAEELIEPLLAAGTFDAVTQLAQPYPLRVVGDMVGLPPEGREVLLEGADAGFNGFGPLNDRAMVTFPKMMAMMEYSAYTLARENLDPAGMAMSVHEAADRGVITEETVPRLLSAYLVAGVDTTVNAIGSAIWLFASQPEAWQMLRDDPTLVPSAFEEVLRIESPVTAFFRSVTTPTEVGTVTLEEGARVMLAFGAANRDERHYPDPDRFDVTRNPADHLSFGHGIHLCAGTGLARLEAHAILDHLVARVDRWELIGPPERRLNNILRGFASLPVRAITVA